MWWSMVAAYGEYKLQKRKIGVGHLKNKVWLAGTNEVLVFRDGPDAYVVFRGIHLQPQPYPLSLIAPSPNPDVIPPPHSHNPRHEDSHRCKARLVGHDREL